MRLVGCHIDSLLLFTIPTSSLISDDLKTFKHVN